MGKEAAFIKLSRKIFENEFFVEHREFSRFEAWLDLIQLCAFEENNSMILKGRIVKWGRGQLIASVRYLQQRWHWKSTKRVFCFLELLRSQNMIETDTSQNVQRITLCKYGSYNSKGNAKETETETAGKQSGNKIKEFKELKKKREGKRAHEEKLDELKIGEKSPPGCAAPPDYRPDPNEVIRFFVGAGGTEEMALKFFNKWDASDWMDGWRKITNWAPLANNYIANWKENENKNANNSKKPTGVNAKLGGFKKLAGELRNELSARGTGNT